MSIQNINTTITAFFIEHGELPCSDTSTNTLHDFVKRSSSEEINFGLFDEIMFDFVKVFGPVMDSLIHNLDQLEDEERINCERAIKALWNGDAETQNRMGKLFKKKVSKKPSTKSKTRKNSSDPEKFFKKIGPDLRKALREMKKEKVNSPRIIFKKKVTPELKKAVNEFKKKRIADKKSEREAKKAEREAKKAEREAKKAEREAKKAEREAKKAEREAKKAEREDQEEENDGESSNEYFCSSDQKDIQSEALRRIKLARPDMSDEGCMKLLEQFNKRLNA